MTQAQKLLQVGIVGTGYAAQRRAEAFQQDPRTELVAVTGNTLEKTSTFAQNYSLSILDSWRLLVRETTIDLVVICTINRDHGAIARAALEAGKHVIVEYPLALNAKEAESLFKLAQAQNKLLHVEHIELLGGLHEAMRQYLPEVGNFNYARYATIVPQRPVPHRWTYHQEMFGFPLTAALSRIHRFTDLFGKVTSVSCQSRYWNLSESGYYSACLCDAQLRFENGLIADIVYGKGDVFWQSDRTFELHGEQGTLIFAGESSKLIRGDQEILIEVAPRRGLFNKDTTLVLDHLFTGGSLYVSPNASIYALKIAEAAEQSSETGTTIKL